MLPNEPTSFRALQAAQYGHIKVSLMLNHRPFDQHTFHGPGEPIEGRIRLDYCPFLDILKDYEVTQQCRLFVALRGQISIRSVPGKMIASAPKGGEYLGRTLTTLFEDEHCVFDGVMSGLTPRSARSANFQIHFPRSVDKGKGCFDTWWDEEDNGNPEPPTRDAKAGHRDNDKNGHTYNMDPAQPLPPSTSFSPRQGPHRMIKNGTDKSEVAVMYDVYARMEMPGLDVAFDYPHQSFAEGMVEKDGSFLGGVRWGTSVLYAQPRVWDSSADEAGGSHINGVPRGVESQTASGLVHLKDAQASEADGSGGFRAKLAAKLSQTQSERPCSWQLSVPESINQGQALVMRVKVQPHDTASSGSTTDTKCAPPSSKRIVVSRASAEIEAHIEARMKLGRHGRQDLAGEESRFEESLDAEYEESSFSVRMPFKDGVTHKLDSEALCADNDWTTELAFPTITNKLHTSFNTFCMRRRHVMTMKCHVAMEGSSRVETFEQAFGVNVLPMLTREGEGSPPPAFALVIDRAKNMSEETLPPYEP